MDKQTDFGEAFVKFVIEHKRKPFTTREFRQFISSEWGDIADPLPSLVQLEKTIWSEILVEAIHAIQLDPVYEDYLVREKLLALLFTFIEVNASRKEFVQITMNAQFLPLLTSTFWLDMKSVLLTYASEIIKEGLDSGEVESRMLLSEWYSEGIWLNFWYVLSFWAKDDSTEQELTDEAIEKSVNLIMDVMNRNAADSVFDFGKFVLTR